MQGPGHGQGKTAQTQTLATELRAQASPAAPDRRLPACSRMETRCPKAASQLQVSLESPALSEA